MQDSMVFYRSYVDALAEIEDDSDFRRAVETLFAYALDGEEPDQDKLRSREVRIVWKLIKPILDSNASRREAGKLGGRPKKVKPLDQAPEAREETGKQGVRMVGFDISKPMVSEKKTYGFENKNHRFSDAETIGCRNEKPDIDMDKDIDIDIKGDVYKTYTSARAKGGSRTDPPDPPLSPMGDHQRVYLSDTQYNGLVSRFGESVTREYIRRLDTHLSTGGHKVNHALVIEDWIIKDKAQRSSRIRETGSPQKGGFHNFKEREYDMEALARKLTGMS